MLRLRAYIELGNIAFLRLIDKYLSLDSGVLSFRYWVFVEKFSALMIVFAFLIFQDEMRVIRDAILFSFTIFGMRQIISFRVRLRNELETNDGFKWFMSCLKEESIEEEMIYVKYYYIFSWIVAVVFAFNDNFILIESLGILLVVDAVSTYFFADMYSRDLYFEKKEK